MYERPGRPHLCLRYNGPELIGEFLSLAGVLLNAFIIANRWTLLPDMAPYGGNAYAYKLWLLILGSILPIGLYVALTMLSGRLDRFVYPVIISPKNSAVEYRLARDMLLSLKLELVWASNVALWYLIGIGPGNHADLLPMAALIILALAAIIATTTYYVWQMRRRA
jgi:hypothetical protein